MHKKITINIYSGIAKRTFLGALAIWLGTVVALAQTDSSGSLGNNYVHPNGSIGVYGNLDFRTGPALSGSVGGVIGTHRDTTGGNNRGFISFINTATWTNATNTAHVDGYVRKYATDSFVFPVGDNGAYRPVGVIAGTALVTAAYYGVDPTSGITDTLPGLGNYTTPLPDTLASAYPSATKSTDVERVSTWEYWDVNSTSSGKITLPWDAASNITTITDSDLDQLTIVGWDGSQWVPIPSTIDAMSLDVTNDRTTYDGAAGTLTAGSITTDAAITLNSFQVYTFGGKSLPSDSGDLSIFPPVRVTYTDDNADGTPDGAGSIWMGTGVTDDRGGSVANATATGDTDDGFTIPADKLDSTVVNNHTIALSTVGTTTVHYAVGIDWDNDGTIDDTYTGSQVVTGSGTATVGVTTPAGFNGSVVNYRVVVASSAADALGGLSGTNFSNGEVEDYQVTFTQPLPVELIAFDAKLAAENVKVTWSTATEINNDYFVVERRMAGEQNFEAVSPRIAGAGNTTEVQHYGYIDRTVDWRSKIAYYRLLQVDYDGTQSYSDIEPVVLNKTSDMLVYPNPTQDKVYVHLGGTSDKATVVLRSTSGQLIDYQASYESDFMVIDVHALATGTYILMIQDDTTVVSKRITVYH